jgi:hypothetical protein
MINAVLAAPPARWFGVGMTLVEVTFALVRWRHPADLKWRAHVLPPLLLAVGGLTVVAQPAAAYDGALLVGLLAYTGYLVYRLGDFIPLSLHLRLGSAKAMVARRRIGRALLKFLTQPWRRMWGQTSAMLVALVSLVLISPGPWQLVAALVCGGAILWLRRPWDQESLPAFAVPALVCWAALLVSIADFTLVWSKPATAELVTQLVASQIALALIPVTIAAAGMQFAVQWIGLRGLGVVPYNWVGATLFTLVVSLSADILAVSGMQYDARGTQYLEVVALGEVAGASLLIALLVRRMEPEIVTDRLAQGLTGEWALQVVGASQALGSFFRPLHRDRFNSLERILYRSAVLEGEVEVFRDTLAAVSRRLVQLRPRQDGTLDPLLGVDLEFEVASDIYFANRFGPLIDEACARRMEWPLLELVSFREEWSGRQVVRGAHGNGTIADADARLDAFHGDVPSGMRLCSMILDRSLQAGLEWSCNGGLASAARYVRRAMNTRAGAKSHAPAGERQSRVGTYQDNPASNGLHSWIDMLEGVGVAAANKGMNRIAWNAAGYLGDAMDIACRLDDPEWAREIASAALQSFVAVAGEGSKHGMNLTSSTLLVLIDADTPSAEAVRGRLSAFFPALVEAAQPTMNAGTATTLAMLAQDVARADSMAGGQMAAALDRVRQSDPNPVWEVPSATQAQRIRMVREAAANREDFDKAFRESGGIPDADWEVKAGQQRTGRRRQRRKPIAADGSE